MAITYDATATSYKNTVDTNSLSFSHTCSGANRLLVVGIAAGNGNYVSSVTYNGVAMTLGKKDVDTTGNNNYIHLYYLIAPATGTNTLTVNVSGSTRLVACSVSYNGVDQTSPIDVTGSAHNASPDTEESLTLTTTIANDWIIGYSGLQRTITGQTNLTNRNTDGYWGCRIADSNAGLSTGANNVKMSHASVGAGTMTMVGIAIKEVQSGGSAYLPKIVQS